MPTVYFSGKLELWKTVHLDPSEVSAPIVQSAEVTEDELSIGSTGRLFPFDGEIPKHTVLIYINRRYVKMFGSIH